MRPRHCILGITGDEFLSRAQEKNPDKKSETQSILEPTNYDSEGNGVGVRKATFVMQVIDEPSSGHRGGAWRVAEMMKDER